MVYYVLLLLLLPKCLPYNTEKRYRFNEVIKYIASGVFVELLLGILKEHCVFVWKEILFRREKTSLSDFTCFNKL